MKKYLGHKRRFIPHKKSSVTYDKSLILINVIIESSIKSRLCRNKILYIMTTQSMWKEYSQNTASIEQLFNFSWFLGIMFEHCWRHQTCDDDIGSSVLKESGIKKKVMLLQDIRNSNILHFMFSANVERCDKLNVTNPAQGNFLQAFFMQIKVHS